MPSLTALNEFTYDRFSNKPSVAELLLKQNFTLVKHHTSGTGWFDFRGKEQGPGTQMENHPQVNTNLKPIFC